MSDLVQVRLHLPDAPTPKQVARLRSLFSVLAPVGLVDLRERLSESTICVLPARNIESPGSLVAAVAELGIDAELIGRDDYAAENLRSLMPSPPSSWQSSTRSIEFLFRPAFDPEAVLRFWESEDKRWVQLASLDVSIWTHRFNSPAWLHRVYAPERRAPGDGEEDEPLRENPQSEVVEAPPIDELVTAALDLGELEPGPGIDGITTDVVAKDDGRLVHRSFWSPRPERDRRAFDLLRRAHELASRCLVEAHSRKRLRELSRTIGS